MRLYMLTIRVCAGTRVTGMECERVAFGSDTDCEGQLGGERLLLLPEHDEGLRQQCRGKLSLRNKRGTFLNHILTQKTATN